ncbi:MAG: hypothetical protein FWC89_06855 [Defluviitaleaceae bacterium]|nr:hypothetical protein [Defluviitaleaceae bacterium]
MIWILSAIVFFVVAVIVFFKIPFSIVKNRFLEDVQKHSCKPVLADVITEQDIAFLPEPVQKHFRVAGLLGAPRMANLTAFMPSVPLRDSNSKPPMIIDFTVCLFAYKPIRLAYIKTSVFGVPFEGYDSFQDGVGFMKGVIGKVFSLFNQKGDAMNKGQLFSYLGEAFLCPSIILSEYIKWEHIDATHAKATITCDGVSGSGVFTFSPNGFVQSFSTDERARISMDGKIDYPRWSGVYEDYESINGIFLPKHIKAIWHLDDGDLVYFESSNISYTECRKHLPTTS